MGSELSLLLGVGAPSGSSSLFRRYRRLNHCDDRIAAAARCWIAWEDERKPVGLRQ